VRRPFLHDAKRRNNHQLSFIDRCWYPVPAGNLIRSLLPDSSAPVARTPATLSRMGTSQTDPAGPATPSSYELDVRRSAVIFQFSV